MDMDYIKNSLLDELWNKGNFYGMIVDGTEPSGKGTRDDYINIEKQIDNFLSNIQSTEQLGWFRMDMFSDEDIVKLGVDFINRDNSRRKLIYNINNSNGLKVIEAIDEKLNYYNPTLEQYKDVAENSDEVEKIMTSPLFENTDLFNKEYHSLTDPNNIINIKKAGEIFSREAQSYITRYEIALKNNILYEETVSLNSLIERANTIFSQLIEKFMIDYMIRGVDTFSILVHICQNIYDYNAHIFFSLDDFDKDVNSSKVKDSSYFLRLSYIYLKGYLCRKYIIQTTSDIDNALVQEQNNNPNLFTPKGYYFDLEQANDLGEEFYIEGTNVANAREKIMNANEIVIKFIGEDYENYFFQKIVFREAYIVNTPYDGKKRYTSIVVDKILNDKTLTLEERIFFQRKILRGKMREYNLNDNYHAYIKVVNAASNAYLEVFKILNFKICIQQIDAIFQQFMSYLLEAYRIKIKRCR